MNMLVKKICLIISICLYIINLFCPVYSFINKDVLSVYDGIPKIYLVGNIDDMNDKKDERKVSINYISDGISFAKFAKIKIQGSSSLRYEKKNYTIKLYNDENLEDSFKVDFGWGKENKYVLKANWIDKTHSRNIVSSNLVSMASNKYGLFDEGPNNGNIDGYPVEVYINGHFLGLYTLNIPKDAWMLGLDEENENHLLFEAEYNGKVNYFRKKANYDSWSLQVGEENSSNLDKLNRLVDFIRNSNDKDFKNNFSKYFNLDSVLNYYVFVDALYLEDNIAKNMLLVTYDGKVWYPLLYDLDTSFGSNPYGNELYKYNGSVSFKKSLLFERFGKLFKEEIKDRYFELREEVLSIENIYNSIDSFSMKISSSSLEKENDRWSNIPGYDLFQMKSFVGARLLYLDEVYSEK